MTARHLPSFGCDVCSKPTTRLLGFAAAIRVAEPDREDGQVLTRFRTSVRGYCAGHKDLIGARFRADADAEGEVMWQADEPASLRPRDVDRFTEDMDRMATEMAEEFGLAEQGTSVTAWAGIKTPCPHCGGKVSYGTGPHVKDAGLRDAVAWECTSCHAAGLLQGQP